MGIFDNKNSDRQIGYYDYITLYCMIVNKKPIAILFYVSISPNPLIVYAALIPMLSSEYNSEYNRSVVIVSKRPT